MVKFLFGGKGEGGRGPSTEHGGVKEAGLAKNNMKGGDGIRKAWKPKLGKSSPGK